MSDPFPWPLAATTSTLPLQFAILLVSLVASAISSASETALTSINRLRIRNDAEEGDSRSQQIETLLAKPNVFLTTILVVNNVAVILASSMATVIAIALVPKWGEVLATVLTSLVVLIFCEVTPKNAAVQNPEAWAKALVPIISGLAWLLRPIITMFNGITNAILRLLGIPLRRIGPSVTEEELRLLVNVGEEEGVFEEGERTMIHHIFELSETTVREVMVPRIDMITLSAETTLAAAVRLIMEGGMSRIPVYDTSIDNIAGVLYAKDILPELLNGGDATRVVREIVRPAYFVPESKKLDDLLHELQNQRVHMAIVIDEYGSVAGLVTIEDLVEEIIGDIQDEYDREEREYEQVSPSEYIIAAKMNIDDLNELLGTELEAGEDYDTVGGLMLALLDKIPVVGDVVRTPEMTLTVLATRGRRITKLQAMLTHPVQRTERDDIAQDDAEAPVSHQRGGRNGVESVPEVPLTASSARDKNELDEDESAQPKREASGSTASLARAQSGRRRARRH